MRADRSAHVCWLWRPLVVVVVGLSVVGAAGQEDRQGATSSQSVEKPDYNRVFAMSLRRLRSSSSRSPMVRQWAASLRAALLMAVVTAGCDGETPTTPTDTTTTTSTTTTVAEATISESFSDRVAVGGAAFYSFTVSANGTVTLTLTSVGGAGVPATVWLAIGLGTPSGEDCGIGSSVNTASGTTAQLTGTYAPGVYCARVWDVGNLAAPASFDLTIAHP